MDRVIILIVICAVPLALLLIFRLILEVIIIKDWLAEAFYKLLFRQKIKRWQHLLTPDEVAVLLSSTFSTDLNQLDEIKNAGGIPVISRLKTTRGIKRKILCAGSDKEDVRLLACSSIGELFREIEVLESLDPENISSEKLKRHICRAILNRSCRSNLDEFTCKYGLRAKICHILDYLEECESGFTVIFLGAPKRKTAEPTADHQLCEEDYLLVNEYFYHN